MTYEPDPRHAELIVKQLGLESAKSLATPTVRDDDPTIEGEEGKVEPLSPEWTTSYKSIVARANFLALDVPDIQFACKELSQRMATPDAADWPKLKRFGRYLAGRPRCVQYFSSGTMEP